MSLSSLCAHQVLLSLWSEAAEAMPAVWTWMAGKGGDLEELRCLCLLSVFKWCAHRVMSDHGHASNCWMARERPCQEGVFVLRILKEGLKVPSPQGPT